MGPSCGAVKIGGGALIFLSSAVVLDQRRANTRISRAVGCERGSVVGLQIFTLRLSGDTTAIGSNSRCRGRVTSPV